MVEAATMAQPTLFESSSRPTMATAAPKTSRPMGEKRCTIGPA
jgi:hypothetical protein